MRASNILQVFVCFQIQHLSQSAPITPENITAELFNTLGYAKVPSYVTQTDVEYLQKYLNSGEGNHDVRNSVGEKSNIPCLSSSELILIYSNNESSSKLKKSDFLHLQTALVQQQVSGVCLNETNKSNLPENIAYLSYVFGTVAVLIISLLSVLGLFLIPFAKSSAYPYLMLFMIAMGTGTLLGDALLHLLPEMLKLHNHNHASSEITLPDYFGLQCGIFIAIYIFFIIETIGVVLDDKTRCKQKSTIEHGHSHIPDLDKLQSKLYSRSHSNERSPLLTTASKSASQQLDHHHHDHHHLHQHHLETCQQDHASIHTTHLAAYMVMIGDAVHNLADGLAVGAAFAQSPTSGISTSLAVLCHEIPHELGDFAILLSAGFSVKRALLLNLLSSISSFLGLFVALPLSVDETLRQWIFSLTVGMFLFIALVEMMPILKEIRVPRVFIGILSSHSGLVFGFGLLVLISTFEEFITI